ncbi:hypothetical protein [Spiroplasma endosymbiont of Virgichneumon dumeticola]|uniref:hypothetical protein n=1 Tax=Spiroplasma endosymbiont of Virgichneumon dumeticola TaxID=3139323 RepID=UPI0035C8A561
MQLVDLSEVLTETNLGNIFTAESKPVANQIKTALKNDGINPNLDVNAVVVQNITATSATIVGDELKYTGMINVTFTVKRVEDIVNWNHGAIRAVTVNSNGIFVGTNDAKYNGNVYMSTDNGQSFTVLRGTTGAIVSLVSDKDGNVYAATETSIQSGKVYVSDGISSFGIVPGLPADSFAKYTLPRALSIDSSGTNIYVVVKYTNFGLGFAEVRSLVSDKNGVIFVGVRTGDGSGTVYVGSLISGTIGSVYNLAADEL